MEKISIIVPCFNEEEALPLFYAETEKVTKQMTDVDFEYIFVDDGSKDGTLNILRDLAVPDKKVRYLSFSRNFGKEAAIFAGLKASTGDYVVLMDADLQDPPALLPQMLKAIREEGYDSAATRRVTRKGEPKLRSYFARRFYKLINRISDADVTDGARDYRLMTRAMTDAVLSLSENQRFTKGIFGWVGFKTKWMEYQNIERVAGQTKWSFFKLMKYAIGGIIDFSTSPLNLAFVFVILSGLAGVGLLAADITLLCLGTPVPLLLSLSTVMAFCVCAISLLMTVQNLYISKIFKETKDRPVYIIRETEASQAKKTPKQPEN